MRQATDAEENAETQWRMRELTRLVEESLNDDQCWCNPWRVCDKCKGATSMTLSEFSTVIERASEKVSLQGIGVVYVLSTAMEGDKPMAVIDIAASDNSIATLAELLESMADELRRAAKQGVKHDTGNKVDDFAPKVVIGRGADNE